MTTQLLRDTYSRQIRMYIASRVQGPAADDVLQQVFLKAHNKLDTIQDKKATKAWLYRITQHTIIDRYRREYGSKSGEMSDLFRDQLEEDTTGSNQKKLAKNMSSCLLPMIEDLDDQTRQVMERYLQPTISHQMIADELGLSLSNVKILIHRAKGKLKEMYAQCCYQYRDEQGTLIDTWCSKDCGCDNSVMV